MGVHGICYCFRESHSIDFCGAQSLLKHKKSEKKL